MAHPIGGIGVNNFTVQYVAARHSIEEPSNPHSIEMRVLSQTGLVGAVLFVGFLASALIAGRRKKIDPFRRGLAGSLLVAFAYWFVHGSIDWFWELPALGAAAFAYLGLAASLAASDEPAKRPSPRGLSRKLTPALVVLAAVLGSASCLGPWLSARDVALASPPRVWRQQPARSYRLLDQARALDPLSDWPDLVAGTIAERRHDWPRMQVYFTRALTRNSRSWYARFELGIADSYLRERRQAIGQLEIARRLDTREKLVRTC